jgi:hypothetical protein
MDWKIPIYSKRLFYPKMSISRYLGKIHQYVQITSVSNSGDLYTALSLLVLSPECSITAGFSLLDIQISERMQKKINYELRKPYTGSA